MSGVHFPEAEKVRFTLYSERYVRVAFWLGAGIGLFYGGVIGYILNIAIEVFQHAG